MDFFDISGFSNPSWSGLSSAGLDLSPASIYNLDYSTPAGSYRGGRAPYNPDYIDYRPYVTDIQVNGLEVTVTARPVSTNPGMDYVGAGFGVLNTFSNGLADFAEVNAGRGIGTSAASHVINAPGIAGGLISLAQVAGSAMQGDVRGVVGGASGALAGIAISEGVALGLVAVGATPVVAGIAATGAALVGAAIVADKALQYWDKLDLRALAHDGGSR